MIYTLPNSNDFMVLAAPLAYGAFVNIKKGVLCGWASRLQPYSHALPPSVGHKLNITRLVTLCGRLKYRFGI